MTKTAIELATERAAERPIAAKARGERFRSRNPKLIVEFDAVLDPVPTCALLAAFDEVFARRRLAAS